MLRIGELAALAGVSVGTVRRYHRMGLLPGPPDAKGRRLYGTADVVRLIRIRRLVALGVDLPDIGRVLGTGPGPDGDLRRALAGLDADLAVQEEAVRRQRAMLAELRHTGPDPAPTPELAQIVGELERVVPAHPLLERARETITLLGAAVPGLAGALAGAYRASIGDEGLRRRLWDVGLRFEELRDTPPEAPEVAVLAEDLGRLLRPFFDTRPSGAVRGGRIGELSPAQRHVVRLLGR
ncbi:MerR family transcriptional regulator [Planobispora takensis]|uniref:MerR family transcriptional regulator n=1 Tax=Planobispora takensis TaxID=1367882 RepID=UPI0019423C02|nr:MerR family transcriptional regulator [Planobispora takensis]